MCLWKEGRGAREKPWETWTGNTHPRSRRKLNQNREHTAMFPRHVLHADGWWDHAKRYFQPWRGAVSGGPWQVDEEDTRGEEKRDKSLAQFAWANYWMQLQGAHLNCCDPKARELSVFFSFLFGFMDMPLKDLLQLLVCSGSLWGSDPMTDGLIFNPWTDI